VTEKAKTQMIVKSGDPDSVTEFIEAEGAEDFKVGREALLAIQKRPADEDISEAELGQLEEVCKLIQARREKFASCLAVRKAKAAGVVK
jgi:hypothetical protein